MILDSVATNGSSGRRRFEVFGCFFDLLEGRSGVPTVIRRFHSALNTSQSEDRTMVLGAVVLGS
jgi:hypothetical protein